MIKLENQTRAVALRWMEEIWSRRDLSVFDEIHAIDFIDHCPAGRLSDRNSYRDGIVELFRAFPDFQAVVDELIVDPVQNKAAIRWSASGTHRGSFLSVMGRSTSGGVSGTKV
jgi:predicted ester cyclase